MSVPSGFDLDGPDDLVRLLTPEGELVADPHAVLGDDPPGWIGGAPSPDEVRTLHRDMVITRRLDREATTLQRQGELGLWASCLGQEAAQVGSGRALRPGDVAFPTYREHGVAWVRGVDPVHLLSLFRGVDHGGWDPVATRFMPYTIVIGAQTLHAVGYGMGLQRDGRVGTGPHGRDGDAVIVYFGDGATSQGDVNEAFIWAAVQQVPVVFFCQNNQFAISEPIERQSRIPLYRRASGFGFPGLRVDGNDVLGVLAVTRQALQRARSGGGPSLIEAYTYRMGAHTTSDDPTRYRLAAEVERWKLRDPIERVRAYLLRRGLCDPAELDEVDAEAERRATRLRADCLALPDPRLADVFARAYATMPAELARQRDEQVAFEHSFVEADVERLGDPSTAEVPPAASSAGWR
jgi:pyruvate dehydrogenase E1 component alpha subunit